MGTLVSDTLLRRSVEHLGAFAREAFRVGISLRAGEARGCVCALHPEGRDGDESCRAFAMSLLTATGTRRRCPQGLELVSRPVELSPEERFLVASQGFFEAGDPPGTAPAVPRLADDQVRLLEGYVAMGADLVRALARTASELPLEEFREESWRDLLGSPTIVGVSPAITALRDALPTLANSAEPLFLAGERGTGRSLVAATVHRLGPHHGAPFIAEDVAALPEALQERDLFGSERSRGLLEEAEGGTIYLASVERLTAHAQERLLKFLDAAAHEGRGRGAHRVPRARVVSSSGADLDLAARRGRFSRALAERLRTLTLAVPPLRERADDVPLLVEHLLRRYAARIDAPPPRVAPEALEALKRHSWTGNVRELETELEAAAPGRSEIHLEDLSTGVADAGGLRTAAQSGDLRQAVGAVEIDLIARTLAETNWNKSQAARHLGLSRLGLQKKIDRYRIDRRR